MPAINVVIAPIALLVCAAASTPAVAEGATPTVTSRITVTVRNSTYVGLEGAHGSQSNVAYMTQFISGTGPGGNVGIGTVTGNGDAFDFRYAKSPDFLANGVNFAVRNYFGVITPECHADILSDLDCGYGSGRTDDGNFSITFFVGPK